MADNQYLENFLSGVKNIEEQRKEKIKKDELIQPIEFDAPVVPETIMADPNPDAEDNKQMRLMNERWAKFAERKHPDDAKKQQEYIEKSRQRYDTINNYMKQPVGGIFDAVNSGLNFTVNRFLDDDSKVLLPTIEQPKDTGSALVRGGVQFMIPYLGWFKVVKGATTGAKLIKAKPKNRLSFKQDLAIGTGAGAITDVVHFEANDPTLSNLIQAYPHLQNPITEYLSTDPDDSEAVNRFKRAVEGMGLGNVFAIVLRGVGHGFTRVNDNMAEKTIRHAIDKKSRPLAPRKNKKGKNIKGKWQARVNGRTVNVTKRREGYTIEVDGVEHSAVYKTLKEIKADIRNVEMHSLNVEEGLKGSAKLEVDEKNPFLKFMNVERRSVGRRIGDWFNGLQIRSYLAIKGFDQYHGIKLVNKALSEKGLDKGGFEDLRMYKESRLLAAVSGSLEHLMNNGTFKRQADGDLVKVGKPLKEILKPLEKDIEDWLHYVVSKRLVNLKRYDPDLKKWVKDKQKFNDIFPNKQDRALVVKQSKKGNTVTADGRTYDEVLKEFDQFNREVLDFAEQSGILSKDHRFKIEQSPHYISLYRDFKGDEFGFTKFSRGVGNGLVKKLRGAPVTEPGVETTAKGFMWDEAKQKMVPAKADVYPFRDFLEGYLENIFGIVKASHRNHTSAMMGKALQRFVDDAEKDFIEKGLSKKDAKKQAIEYVGRIWGKKTSAFKLDKSTVDLSSKNVRAQLEDMNLDLKDANLDDLVFYSPSRIKLQDNQFIFSKNVGDSRELEMWEISNPFLAESMMAMGDRIVKHTFRGLGLARGFKTLLTRGVTYDPGFFMYANLIRDSVASSILSKDGYFGIGGGAIPIVSTGKGLLNQIRKNGIVKDPQGNALKNYDGTDMRYQDLWREFTLNGGGFDSTLMRSNLQENRVKHIYQQMGLDYKFVINRSKYMQAGGVKGVKKAINGFDDFVGAFEYASRFAEYHRLRRRGVSAREASFQAREIATDFAMHGTGSLLHFFTQTVPFLNAGLQGLYRTLRAGEGLTKSQKQLMAAKIATAVLLPTVFFRYINRDNPEYAKLTQHTRDMHWVIPKSGGGHFLIPKPFEWGAIGTILDRWWDAFGPSEIKNPLTGERMTYLESDEKFTGYDFAEVFTKIMSEQMRLNIMPQIFTPFTSLATNSRFTGSPIVPQYMKSYLPDSAQDYPWTNAMLLTAFKKNPEWGGWQGLSPIAMEHIIKSYTGTIGAYVMDFIVDPAFREEGLDLSGGLIPPKPDVTGFGFGTWDNAPLIKRLFVGETPRHTKNIIDSYKLKNEVTKRVNELKKLKDEGFFEQAIELAQSPGMQDILALDKGLQGQFIKLQEIAKAEKLVFSKTFEGDSKFRGEQLEEIRKQKIKLTDELIGMLEAYNLDYIIPRTVTLPFSGSQLQLPKRPQGQNISIGSTNITSSSQAFGNSITEMLHGN
jgi:hypothetical protein